MTPYSQRDYSDQLGTCNVTIKTDGCFITSLGMLCDKNPSEVNQILRDNGGYSDGCLVNSEIAATLLGLEYYGKNELRPNYNCIAETDFYSNKGYPQHFFVLLTNGEIIDPLIGYQTANHYENNIVSYRLFEARGETMTDDQAYRIIEPVWRRLMKGYPVPDKNAMMADAHNIAVGTTAGGWPMDILIQKWIKQAGLMYKADCKPVCDRTGTINYISKNLK